MKRRSELVGLAVVNEKGQRIGRVSDICLDVENRTWKETDFLENETESNMSVHGIQVQSNALFKAKRWVPLRDVRLMGEKSIIVSQNPARTKVRNHILPGQRVLSTNGGRLGVVTDALIDEKSGKVVRLEVSHGYIDDMLRGREWVDRFTLDRPSGTVIAIPQNADGREGHAHRSNERHPDG